MDEDIWPRTLTGDFRNTFNARWTSGALPVLRSAGLIVFAAGEQAAQAKMDLQQAATIYEHLRCMLRLCSNRTLTSFTRRAMSTSAEGHLYLALCPDLADSKRCWLLDPPYDR
jgi:hypothetical protein